MIGCDRPPVRLFSMAIDLRDGSNFSAKFAIRSNCPGRSNWTRRRIADYNM